MDELKIISEIEKLISKKIQADSSKGTTYYKSVEGKITELKISSVVIPNLDKISDLLLNLTSLFKLSFEENSIKDISFIKKLNRLRELSINFNSIEDITPIKSLTNLSHLALYDNLISDITPLTNLVGLKSLMLKANQIENLASLSNLKALTTLLLYTNKIADITPLKDLQKLHTLGLNENPITRLPDWVTNFDMGIKLDTSWSTGFITISRDNLIYPPPEIITKGKKALQAWLKGDRVYVNEAKVLLVGHGEVGKTTLVKCLTGKKPTGKEKATQHINISSGSIQHKSKKIKLNYWDFGGQEVMHSTHQFFLSSRSIYILVLDGRRDEDAEYWLKHIESFGGNSPVLVVLNKVDSNPGYDLDRRFLKEKYPFIIDFYRTSCIDKKGISDVQKGIKSALDNVEVITIPWPIRWLPIKEKLESAGDNFISQAEYEKICKSSDLCDSDTQETLASFLNDIGVIVHFRDMRLNDLHILQPRWASRAAYKIINSSKIADHGGLLKTEWLADIMKKSDVKDFSYPASVFPFILDLMQKFELCFAIKENKEYLIPELLGIQQPELPKHKGPVLRFYFQFGGLLPRSIMTRFIVRMHEDIKENLRWRTGVVLFIKIFDSLAIVVADIKEKRINISISGARRREHFAIIRKTFHDLRSDFEKLEMTEWIPIPDQENLSLEYQELIGYEESKIEEIFVGKIRKKYPVKDLLDGIEPENIRKDQYKWDVFLSYSSKDLPIIKNIIKDFKATGISYWWDEEQIAPGDNIIDVITDGLLKSRNIMPCISANQLKSGWGRAEYQSVLGKIISGTSAQRVIPFIIDDIQEKDVPHFLQSLRAERYTIPEQYNNLLDFLSYQTTIAKSAFGDY